MNTVIIKLCVAITLLIGCGSEDFNDYAPYRPNLGGDYYLQYEACGQAPPHLLEAALVCESACCIWAFERPNVNLTCEETWCCHADLCEWFFHYEECY